MSESVTLDRAWLRAHPLPALAGEIDKNERGRVLVVGGSMFVPGALRLTGEAALRAGAGKLQLATVEAAAMALGVLVPEAAMIALPHDDKGDITAEAADVLARAASSCDAMILGPGMMEGDESKAFLARLLAAPAEGLAIVLDAGCLPCARTLDAAIRTHDGRVIMTPHHGEMAALLGCDVEAVAADPGVLATDTAERFGAVIVLKAATTHIAAPDGRLLIFSSDCPGLATGGSGDVLAGIIGSLAARGTDPFSAAAHGVWLHGKAGRRLAKRQGRLGFLARHLPAELPRLLDKLG